ncbi:methylated-DNA--protein-cysteine methyltransferase [Thoreauomyces humboldtii]|nr:methylated-DNA--protein-cysteine methyltransferase [Thoreauomyces humboldtii]
MAVDLKRKRTTRSDTEGDVIVHGKKSSASFQASRKGFQHVVDVVSSSTTDKVLQSEHTEESEDTTATDAKKCDTTAIVSTDSTDDICTQSPERFPSLSAPPTHPSTPTADRLQTLISTSPLGTPFQRRVWSLLLEIPPGSASTYGLLATRLDSSPRAVGNALRRNPFAPQVPCHRVVAAKGRLGGFKGSRSGREMEEKTALLRSEGCVVVEDAGGMVLVGDPWSEFA